jgi:hypothetical protein
MNGCGRCQGCDGWGSGDSCPSGAPGSPGTLMGVRPGMTIRPGGYSPDPVRDPGAYWNNQGYLRSGYDTFRAQIRGTGER